MIRLPLPKKAYVPGMGILTGLFIAIQAGFMMRLWFFRKLVEWGEGHALRLYRRDDYS